MSTRIGNRIYYGWVIVATLAVTETVSWGVLFYAFGAFLPVMRTALGWTDAQLTGAYSLGLLVSGIAAPLVGRWIDRRGPRLLMTTGSLLGVALVLLWSRLDTLTAWYLLWIGMGLAMSATLYDPAFTAVTAWFDRGRAKALLYVTIAAGFASTIFLPLSSWLIARHGWREALVVLAIVLLALAALPHAIFLRQGPESLGVQPDGARSPAPGAPRSGAALGEAIRDPAFWWMAGGFALETFSGVAVGVYLISYLTDRGDGAGFAALATGLIGAAQVTARILATILGQRVSQVTLTAAVIGLQAAAVALLLLWQTDAGVLLAVLILGMGRGVGTLMRAGLVATFYGRANFGAINGSLALILNGSRALAPVAAGVAYAALGGYESVFWCLAAISALGALLMLGLRRTDRARSAHRPA